MAIGNLIYPEKTVLKENEIQTIRPNRAIELICRPIEDYSDLKNKTDSENGGGSNVVTRIGHFSNRFLNNLRLIVDLSD
jgi:hypothetical protein